MDERRLGVFSGLGAYALWGLFPLYFPLLEPAGGLEIVAHRVLWSLLFVGILLTVVRRWGHVRAAARNPRSLLVLAGAAVLIAANWLIFVYGVNSGQVVETSLGYFINPLVSVLLGVVVFSERLRPLQWVAVGVAAVAVLVLTLDYGRPPWIALSLAATFGLYGVMKKLVAVEAAPGLFLETALVAVPAAVTLGVLHGGGEGTFANAGAGHALLLMSSGVATAVPLLLFATAARRIPLSTVGLLQYLTPLMQLAIGVFVYDEPMPPARLAGFVIVWVALAVFTADMLRHARAGARRTSRDPVVVTP
ncbi:EamA family transporter RarD [Blastococcus sp. TBT05-19]|uniref:EamA family transporter RarD n=1 Tax=Blastococcus sp. TBT05-19 TaxID=2250581 RepID=UPI000DEA6CC6|nr:EamA family transporter RarD [Blastococcus sp. TBT05-19]RBY94139.1 EamA family transporter RarD [Blastococcus sp. TBT05-19]